MGDVFHVVYLTWSILHLHQGVLEMKNDLKLFCAETLLTEVCRLQSSHNINLLEIFQF